MVNTIQLGVSESGEYFITVPHRFAAPQISTTIQCRSKGNITGGGARERRRREPLGGSGGMLPQKILKARGLEMLFPAFSKSDM